MAKLFNYTPKLVNLLVGAEALYGQLESQARIPSLALRLIQENQVLATHFSTSIEGNPLTQIEVTNIVFGDKVPTTKSEKEVKNYFEVLNRISVLAREKKPLTLELTLSLHKDLMKDLQVKDIGKLRNESVIVGHRDIAGAVHIKHNPPAHTAKEIEDLLTKLYEDVLSDKENQPLVVAGVLHHNFVYIHPFVDGNGRLGRILTAYYLLLNGYEVTKYFILDDYYDIDRLQYSDMLHSADSGNERSSPADKTKWLEYFVEGINYSLQAAIRRVEDLQGEDIDAVTGTKRVLVSKKEEEVIQLLLEKKVLKAQDLVERFSITRQRAGYLLNSLVKKGIIQKQGKTKSSYYELTAREELST